MNLNKIYAWYKSQSIDPWNFNCKHEDQCRKGSAHFTTIRPPQIGERYYKNDIPRLLVISSDPGSGDDIPHEPKFTPSRPDQRAEKHHKGKHWSKTLYMVKAIQNSFDQSIDLQEANSCFTHIRAVKCCQNKKKSKEADPELFEECKYYIAGEVELFKPDIIITQGRRAEKALKLGNFPYIVKWTGCKKEGHKCEYGVIDVAGKPTLFLFSYHPTSRGGHYHRSKDGYFSCYPKLAKIFINSPDKIEKL